MNCTENVDIISIFMGGMSVLSLVIGSLFFIGNLTLWRTKLSLEMAEIANLAYPDLHNRAVEELEKLNSLRRINKFIYIVFFTLSLVMYASYVYWTKNGLPFDLMMFCISVVVTVPITLFLSWFGSTTRFKLMRYSYYLEFLFGAILAVLWIATLFFFFYLFPWLGCLTAVLFIIVGIVVIRFLNKYGYKNNILWQG